MGEMSNRGNILICLPLSVYKERERNYTLKGIWRTGETRETTYVLVFDGGSRLDVY